MRIETWADGALVDVVDDGLPDPDEPVDPVAELEAQVVELRAALEALLGIGGGGV